MLYDLIERRKNDSNASYVVLWESKRNGHNSKKNEVNINESEVKHIIRKIKNPIKPINL